MSKPKSYKDGEPCGHPGCLSHTSHPCEGCGRLAAGTLPSQEDAYIRFISALGIDQTEESRIMFYSGWNAAMGMVKNRCRNLLLDRYNWDAFDVDEFTNQLDKEGA